MKFTSSFLAIVLAVSHLVAAAPATDTNPLENISFTYWPKPNYYGHPPGVSAIPSECVDAPSAIIRFDIKSLWIYAGAQCNLHTFDNCTGVATTLHGLNPTIPANISYNIISYNCTWSSN